MQRRRRKQKNRDAAPVRWIGLGEKGGGERRFYQLDTLARATERLLKQGESFLSVSFRSILASSQPASFQFTLAREDVYRLIFHTAVSTARGKRVHFGYVVAKNHREFSVLLRAEAGHLRKLHDRAPKLVVQLFRSGAVYLPDRYRRAEGGREIEAYITDWRETFHPLGVAGPRQFLLAGPERHTFSVAETEKLRGKIVETLAAAYDPTRRQGVDLRELAPADFIVGKTRAGSVQLRLAACRRLRANTPPQTFLHRLLELTWEGRRGEAFVVPEEPQALRDALMRGAGKENAQGWIRRWAQRTESLDDYGKALAEGAK